MWPLDSAGKTTGNQPDSTRVAGPANEAAVFSLSQAGADLVSVTVRDGFAHVFHRLS